MFLWHPSSGAIKPSVKADTSNTEDNPVDPPRHLTEPVKHLLRIGHEVTKRCSSDEVENCHVVHNNLPRQDNIAGTEDTSSAEDQIDELANHVFRIESKEEHTQLSVSTLDLLYRRPFRKWIQRLPRKTKVDYVPVTLSIVRDSYPELGVRMTTEKITNKTLNLDTERMADTGCSVLCGGTETDNTMECTQKIKYHLKTADRKPLPVLEVIPVDVTVRGSKRNTSRQPLQVEKELSTLFISKICLQELGIISDSFPLPEKMQ